MRRCILFVIYVLVGISVHAQNDVQQVLNKYIDSIENYGIIALVADDKGISSGTIGMADDTTRLTDKHLMCIGSITKTYTATLIFKLQDKGLLDVGDNIGKYLQLDNPFIDTTITIIQLLNHSSGLKDFGTVELLNEVMTNSKKIYTTDFCLSKIDTVAFKKGEKHSYSNSNYLLLAMIVEQVAQMPIEEAYRKYLFEPYGLQNTYPYISKTIDGIAHPMWRNHDMFNMVSFKPVNDISIGDGNIVTSAKELYKFYKLLFQDWSILSDNSYSDMLTMNKGGGKSMYGCGIFSRTIGDKQLLYHTGRQLSYIATCVYIQNERKFVIVLTNNMDDEYADLVVNDLLGVKFY